MGGSESGVGSCPVSGREWSLCRARSYGTGVAVATGISRAWNAFDRHRVGAHAFTFTEGLDLDPPREDGRRCLDEAEMFERGMDPRGRWRIVASEAGLAWFEQLRSAA